MPNNLNASLSLEERITNLKRLLFNKYYDNLNDRQREAVFSVKGNLLVLAGAGSGKTTALVNRISHILSFGDAYYSEELPTMTEREVTMLETILKSGKPLKKEGLLSILMQFRCDVPYPDNILSITFTNKAANEMKTRLKAVLGESAEKIWAGTFHSICVRLLRRYIDTLGYPSSFTIYDTDDVKKLVTECMKEMELDEKSFPVKTLMNVISRAKNKLITPDKFPVGGDFRELKYQELYAMYQKRLSDSGAVDFDDIIMLTVRLLRENEDAREYCQRKFQYVLVDEYQDTNRAQYELLRIITEKQGNLMVVGDDDQSIYRFRGAVVENILRFEKDFKDTKVVLLEQNYRSTKNIINAANSVIKNNESRHNKALWCDAAEGDKLDCILCANQEDEAQKIINIIQTSVASGKGKLSDFAVLYRMNAQSGVLETAFSKAGVPHRLLGGIRFFSRAEVKDIISYLCLINNPADDLRLMRILNVPKRGIGDKAVDALREYAQDNGVSLFDAIKMTSRGDTKKNKALSSFASMIEKLRDVKDNDTLPALVEKTIYESGYLEMLVAQGAEGEDRIKNINELISGAASYADSHDEPTLSGYLEEVALVADIDNYDASAEAVTLMTVHSAKGLEFNHVFLPGAEEGVFPSVRNENENEEIEEERRLFYVAVTRARKNLTVLHTKQRMLYGRTQFNRLSRFAEEIPDDYLSAPKETNAQRSFGGYLEDDDKDFFEDGYRKNKYGERREGGYDYERFTTGYERSYNDYRELTYSSPQRTSSQFGRSSSPATKSTHPATPKPQSKEAFASGDKVNHKIFGEGTVLKATPMGNDVLYEVEFGEGNVKKLMGNYANMTRCK